MALGGIILAAVLLGANPSAATDVCIAIDDRVNLSPRAREHFQEELQALVAGDGEACVLVRFRLAPPLRYGTALGLAFTERGRVLPIVEVYVRPIERLLDKGFHAAALGRALAKVAAHEILHYRLQRFHHDASGLFKHCFSQAELVALTR